MGDENQVKNITISAPHYGVLKTVDLPPWGTFSEGAKEVLKGIDVQSDNPYEDFIGSDGSIHFNPSIDITKDRPNSDLPEVYYGDKTFDLLSRVLLGYGLAYPQGKRSLDNATRATRKAKMAAFQQDLFKKVVLPILGDKSDPKRWEEAKRVLLVGADFRNLLQLAKWSLERWKETKKEDYLRLTKDLAEHASRFASMVVWATADDLDEIDRFLGPVNALLDQRGEKTFDQETERPYLLARRGTPITVDAGFLKKGIDPFFEVAVPPSFLKAHEKDIKQALLDYYNKQEKLILTGGTFRGSKDHQEIQLNVVRVDKDEPGPFDNPINPHYSPHVNQERLNRDLFGKEMTYFRIYFRLPKAEAALKGLGARLFDISLKSSEGSRMREGAFVLQDTTGRDSRTVVAGDAHVSRRDRAVRKILVKKLNEAIREGKEIDPLMIDQVEYFCESINEHLVAAVEEWNDLYRQGKIDRVHLLGDNVDFVNTVRKLQKIGYNSTNVSLLNWILSKAEFPLYLISGNHDQHGPEYDLSVYDMYFYRRVGLRKLFKDFYDDGYMITRYVRSIASMYPQTCSGFIDCTAGIFHLLKANGPHDLPNTDFMNHFYRELAPVETYGISLGNRVRLFADSTETEHYNFDRYAVGEVHPPRAKELIRGTFTTYVGKEEVNAIGQIPENLISFIRELEITQIAWEWDRELHTGHYPDEAGERGPDGTPFTTDSLRGDAATAYALAFWYYGVTPLSLAAHIHKYSESEPEFQFTGDEEKKFRTELGAIFKEKNRERIFDQIHDLRHKWGLDRRRSARKVEVAGEDGYPGPIASGPLKGPTKNVTTPVLGPGDDVGYLIVTTHPDGKIDLSARFFAIRSDALIDSVDGRKIAELRKRRWREAKEWEPALPPGPEPTFPKKTPVDIKKAEGASTHSKWDAPVFVCPEKNTCLTGWLGAGLNFRKPIGNLKLGASLLIPTTKDYKTWFGGPNYAELKFDYNWLAIETPFETAVRINYGTLTTGVFAKLTRDGAIRAVGVETSLIPFHVTTPFPHLRLSLEADRATSGISGTVGIEWPIHLLSREIIDGH